MKLINLNTWAGRLKDPLEDFLKRNYRDTDIFCFQEIFNEYEGNTNDFINHSEGSLNILNEIAQLLPDFNMFFCPVAENVYGIAIFLKKGIEVIANGEVIIFAGSDVKDHTRKMQWLHIKNGRKDLMILNTHGHWDPSGRNDTPNRIEQSKAINSFIESTGSIPKILVGDLNLNLDTQSIKMIEKYFINLVKEKGIETTRTELYTGEDKHTDYVFISPEIFLENFKILPDIVSDHSPLFIEFDVF